MPFDGRDNTPALNRARLIEALRAKMPAGFIWDYNTEYSGSRCGAVGCALGLAQQIGLLREHWTTHDPEGAFGMSDEQVVRIFYDPTTYGLHEDDYENVAPSMVADALERLL